MKKLNHLDSIISPTVTEKATSLSEHNKVVFKVSNKATKKYIKKSIEKIFNQFLEKNKLKNSLIIPDKISKSKIIKSARNIPNLKIIDQEGANVYDLLKYKNVIFTITSIKSLQDRLSKWENLTL